MKIAICICGQPRTIEKCHKRWLTIFKEHEVDFFFHLWDYNTLPNELASKNGGMIINDEKITETEKNSIVNMLNPKKFIFEPRKKIIYWNTQLPLINQFGWWAPDQFYSLYYSSLLKQQYELEHNFRYDAVLRMRSDLWFVDDDFKLCVPEHNTVYSAYLHYDIKFQCFTSGEVFYYADSYTFDQAAKFFKFLPDMSTKYVSVDNTSVPPEMGFYAYLATTGIYHRHAGIDWRLMRDERIKELKGGTLNDYETI